MFLIHLDNYKILSGYEITNYLLFLAVCEKKC
jgi:hypothetical protein